MLPKKINSPEISEDKQSKKRNLPQLFKPGQSGNPAGRPKGTKALSTLLVEYLKRVNKETGKTEEDGVLNALLLKANKGDTKAIEIVFDRVDGKPKQSLDIEANVSERLIILPSKEINE